MLIHRERVFFMLRFISWVVLPWVSVIIYVFLGILHVRTPQPITGVVIVIEAYLGITLQISTVRYRRRYRKRAGSMVIQDYGDRTSYSLVLDTDPQDFCEDDELIFKVQPVGGRR